MPVCGGGLGEQNVRDPNGSPATPTWQVYNGTFGLASSPTRATLAPVEGDRLNLAVREGTYGDDYDIEAKLEGSGAGIAFRVQDKLNYYYVWQISSGSLCYVILSKVIDGQDQQVAFSWTDQCDTSAVRHLHVKASGADLDVWVKEAAGWPASALISSSGDGQGVLSEIASGRVGMTTKDAETATCSLLRVGSDADSDHVLDTADEAWVNETFAASVSPTYDDAGNMTSDGIYNYTYDAWNRLVKVTRLGPTSAPQAIATYAYDALGRRYRKIVSNSGDRDRTEYFYYDGQWRLLEVRNASDAATRQFVWGTQYIDELVCMDVDTDNDGSCIDENEGEPRYGFERYRYFQDANWNVTAIWADHAGKVVERYEYDPYGTCRIFAGWDSAAGGESRNVIGESLVPGGNPIRFAGYYYDDETDRYHVRHRMYSPGLGRWLQRDPLFAWMPAQALAPEADLYLYIGDMPMGNTDPHGLCPPKGQRGKITALQCCEINNVLMQGCMDATRICIEDAWSWFYVPEGIACFVACLPLIEMPMAYAGCVGGCETGLAFNHWFWHSKCMKVAEDCFKNAKAQKRNCIGNACDCDEFDPEMSCPRVK